MTRILLLGGTGKVARRIAPLLAKDGHDVVLMTRSGKVPEALKTEHGDKVTAFAADINNKASYEKLFATYPDIKAVFLVAPPGADALGPLKPFIDYAIPHGVKRFVLLSASTIEKGGPAMGEVHEYLAGLDVEWAVLRPTWFQQNFDENQHLPTIKSKDCFYSATGTGKVPFVSTHDIGRMGAHALTTPKAPNTDYLLLGPDLLSYDDCAEIFSSVLGRKITHVSLPEEQLRDAMVANGVPADLATMLAVMDTGVSQGCEERLSDDIAKTTGQKPVSFKEFVTENKSVWMV